MKIVVISLLRSVDRRHRIEQQMIAAGLQFEFLPAVDAIDSGFSHVKFVDEKKTLRRKGYTLLPSEVACFLSHKKAWERCNASNEPLLILEDNVDLAPDLPKIIDKLLMHIDKFQFIKLSATLKRKFSAAIRLDSTYSLGQFAANTASTVGYMLTPDAARIFSANTPPFLEPVDDYLEKPWIHGIQTYSISPSVVTRADVPSVVGEFSSKRKIKSGIGISLKISQELFRIYENALRFLFW